MKYATVKDGASMQCTLGTASSKLKVPKNHGVQSQGGYQATIGDSVGDTNIPSFTLCKRIPPPEGPVPCTPRTCMKWLKGHKNMVLDNDLALLECCIIPCIYGGVISFTSSGQK